MTTRPETLARMVETSIPLATRYFAGFNDSNRAAQCPGLPNHFAWSLGHCAMYMHKLAERLDGLPLPEADFLVDAAHAEGTPPERFGTESIAFNSSPAAEAGAYPTVARCRAIFEAAGARLAAAVRGATDERLSAPEPWGADQLPMADLVVRVTLHNAVHTGQLIDLRRGLGLNRILG